MSAAAPNAAFQAAKAAVIAAIQKEKGPIDTKAIVKAHTADVNGYFAWAADNRTERRSVALSAMELLAKLQATRFDTLGSLTELSDAAIVSQGVAIPLVTDAAQKIEYVVVVAQAVLSVALEKFMTDDTVKGPAVVTDKLTMHPYLYRLAPPAGYVAPKAPAPALPTYVLPVGTLMSRPAATPPATDARTFAPTGYSTVVDAVGADHGVWLVWNRHPLSPESYAPLNVDPAKQKVVFAGAGFGGNFDAALVMPKLAAWNAARPIPLADFEASAKTSRLSGEVTPNNVWMDDFVKVLPLATTQAP